MFASWTAASLSRALASADPDQAVEDSRGYDSTRIGKLEDTLRRYEDHFNRHLRILMDRLVDMYTRRCIRLTNQEQFELLRRHGECCVIEACALSQFHQQRRLNMTHSPMCSFS